MNSASIRLSMGSRMAGPVVECMASTLKMSRRRLVLSVGWALACVVLAVSFGGMKSFGAIIVANSGFNLALSDAQAGSVGNVDPVGEVTDVWYANNTSADTRVWRQGQLIGPSNVLENVAYVQSTTNATQTTRGMMQVVSGTSSSTGLHNLKFDFLMNDGDSTPRNLIFGVEVFGIANWLPSTTGNYDLAEPNNTGVLPVTYAASTPLLSTQAFTKTTNLVVTGSTWQSASIPVDLGAGYPFIGIRFTGVKGFADTSGVTQIAVDNISMTAVPEPAGFALTGLVMVALAAFRFRRA